MNDDRRQYSRVAFHSVARLVLSLRALDTVVIDLSLKGALVRLPAGTTMAEGETGKLHVRLGDDSDMRISMDIESAHVEGRYAGLRCAAIDLDSVTHLRRLVELNLGDPELLDRELSSLIVETDAESEDPENPEGIKTEKN
ncbi:PilZ domain-containing protein [uncultured Propionivibrio sp.]|uniref:PilZ domain-containing protein n=1 Tax=uncultured Propionivibrio sp. TaxID=426737 RepID=UPI0029C033B8|nr:PilZ domain-containing protein [uncultured Propionivibrio sp.]